MTIQTAVIKSPGPFFLAGKNPDTGESAYLYSVSPGVKLSEALEGIQTKLITIDAVLDLFDDGVPGAAKWIINESLEAVLAALGAVIESLEEEAAQ